MSKYQFGKVSLTRLSTCHEDLQLVAKESLKVSDVDFGIAEGHRSPERQNEMFKQGKSKIDGITKLGNHNYNPSRAFDIYGFVNGRTAYNQETIIYLAGVITGAANQLFAMGAISHKIRWGGNWDKDGEVMTDQKFDDAVHFEIYIP